MPANHSSGLCSRVSQLFICMSIVAVTIIVLVSTRQDLLLAENVPKMTPPPHFRAYLDTFSSTLNNVSSLTSSTIDNLISTSTNTFNSFTTSDSGNSPVFSNDTFLPDLNVLTTFSNKLFVHHTPDNLFSPVSLLYLLSFLRLGMPSTVDVTKERLLSMSTMSQYFAHFGFATNADAHMVQLLCVNNQYPLTSDFQSNYGHFLPVVSGNFSHKPTVNEQIRKVFLPATQNEVNPIAKGIRPESTAVLYDTFYFRAIWAEPFSETQTKYIDFTQSNGKKRNIRALHRVFKRLSYLETDVFQLLEIPFDPQRYVFGLFLPKHKPATFNIKYDMDFQILQDVHIPAMQMQNHVMVTFPKLRQRQWLRLSSSVKKISEAYRSLFDKAMPAIAAGSTVLNEIIHEVPLTLWEGGANIAENAATIAATVSMSQSMGIVDDAQASVSVLANRQFVYYIRDRLTNALLLVGDFDA